MQLIIDTKGTYLRKRNDAFQIKNETSEKIISPHRLKSVAITTQCMISTSAIELAVEHRVPIFILDCYGDVLGKFWSAELSHMNQLRRKQVLALESVEFRIEETKLMLSLKLQQQLRHLKQLSKDHGLKERVEQTIFEMGVEFEQMIAVVDHESYNSTRFKFMGYEGSIAKRYWQLLNEYLPASWKFIERSRRPAKDAFNALINYGYGMLYHLVEQGIHAAGLDPTYGFLHRDQGSDPSLSYDLIEPFRPWVDGCLVRGILSGDIDGDVGNSDGKLQAWTIPKALKRKWIGCVLEEWDHEKEMSNRIMSFKDHVYNLADELAERIAERVQLKDV